MLWLQDQDLLFLYHQQILWELLLLLYQKEKLLQLYINRFVKCFLLDDATLRNLLDANTEVVCIVGKASEYHVAEALRTSPEEGIAMVEESVRFLKNKNLKVFFDAEHFFDGYKDNPDFSLAVLEGAARGGADCVVLCDTNGGSLPPRSSF